MAPGKESRFCPRARLNPPLKTEYHHAYRVALRDLSLTGAYLAGDLPFRIGQDIHLTVWLSDNEAIEVEAVVRRAVRGKGLGIEFVRMSEADSARLRGCFYSARISERTTNPSSSA